MNQTNLTLFFFSVFVYIGMEEFRGRVEVNLGYVLQLQAMALI